MAVYLGTGGRERHVDLLLLSQFRRKASEDIAQ